jgi:hypothetical protein
MNQPVDCAGDGHGMDAGFGQRQTAARSGAVGIEPRRCPPAAVVANRLGSTRRKIKRKAVASNAGRLRFDDAKHEACRDCCVYSIAALSQSRQGGGTGQRMGGCDGAIEARDGRTSRFEEVTRQWERLSSSK